MDRVAREQDDILCTIQLVAHDTALQARLFDQLVDLLVESMFLDVRRAHVAGEIDQQRYVKELAELALHCRDAGLLPLPSRNS
jgi:hypothetical protein